ncbi:MAG: bifunctional DNA-formamidopyrimidine glycosylase/DNA-(apurinic or apyrimidinic site) lyase [Motiliproteus sp.]
MPELPEVETTLRGITPHVLAQKVTDVIVRQPKLRWPIPADLKARLQGGIIEKVERRAKYLLITIGEECLILHLGMSGSLRLTQVGAEVGKHDHFDLCLRSGTVLRLTDPRRFGAVLCHQGDPLQHALLMSLGPEPLTDQFDGERLYRLSRNRKLAVKLFLMDNKTVVGVGNIYANEALYAAGIDPRRAAGRISLERYLMLAERVKIVLARAIEQGGTTLKDFVGGDGKPGYFQQQLQVYGKAGEPCPSCDSKLQLVKLGQRATVYCPQCQR